MAPTMDAEQSVKLTGQRLRLFAQEAASVQEELDALYERLARGEDVPGSDVKTVAEHLRRARSRMIATIEEDAA